MTAPRPRPEILEIAPYIGGESSVPGVNRVYKLSSNEGAFGVPPGAQEAYRIGLVNEVVPRGELLARAEKDDGVKAVVLRIDSPRFGIVPRLRTSPSGSATATAIVSAWTSKPKNRTFSFMTGSLPLVALNCVS